MNKSESEGNIISSDPRTPEEARRIDLLAHAGYYEAGIRTAVRQNNRKEINLFYARKMEVLEEVAASFPTNHNSV
ncbi:MAG: hypothetical protein HYT08_05005 [Candidatus Levybacteria bacterium]|nr:hypothetical protein [Candidatus Levybacteria bacterium]